MKMDDIMDGWQATEIKEVLIIHGWIIREQIEIGMFI
jgi:hypothetical protein